MSVLDKLYGWVKSPFTTEVSRALAQEAIDEIERLEANIRYGWEVVQSAYPDIGPDGDVASDKPHKFGSYILDRLAELESERDRLKWAHDQCAVFLHAHGWDWEEVMKRYDQ